MPNTVTLTHQLGVEKFRLWERHDLFSDRKLRSRFSGIQFLRSHRLNHDLAGLLDSCARDKGITLDTRFILDAGRILPKMGGRSTGLDAWKSSFDDELIDFVLRKDRMLLRAQPWLLEEFPPRCRERLDDILAEKRKLSLAAT